MLRQYISYGLRSDLMYNISLSSNFNALPKIQKDLARQERALLMYTIAITLVHLAKSAQQVTKKSRIHIVLSKNIFLKIFWYITIIIENAYLFDLTQKMVR